MNSINIPNDVLAKYWDDFDWKDAERKLFRLQQLLSKATFKYRDNEIKRLSQKIVTSVEIKALAVRKVSEELKSAPGIDKVRWITSEEKMKAVFSLSAKNYKAKPFKRFVISDSKSNKERRITIPTMYDRAMQVLYSFALDPIAEASADRKSFAFRKGRSTYDVHELIMKMFSDKNSPEWVLICDVKSYYDTISHKWLLNNIPMDKHVLREFLKAGIVFDGEIFPNDIGISLGCNISPLLGNMVLDGIQKLLYSMQDKEDIDYWDGYAIRFADDIIISARTKEKAEKYLKIIKDFLDERGLQLSPNKTFIKNINDGFDFLARHYYKANGYIHSIPSTRAINNLENELYNLLIENDKRCSQKKLIQLVNSKLTGWASYHRVENSLETFKKIDNVVSALLLKRMKKMHPNKDINFIVKKYWTEDYKNRKVFTLVNNKNIKIIKMEDITLVEHKVIDTKKNPYLDLDYFEKRNHNLEIEKSSGKYKNVWLRQNGICYYCGKSIKPFHEREIVFKKLNNDKTISNMAYIHKKCKKDEIVFIDAHNNRMDEISIEEIIKKIQDPEIAKLYVKNRKYRKLYEYFAKIKKYSFCITFKDLENIIDNKLCNSLYKYQSYWYQNGKGTIAECWINNGYKIKRLYLKEKKVTFIREKKERSKINIPNQLLSSNLPIGAKYELEQTFEYIIKKYGL